MKKLIDVIKTKRKIKNSDLLWKCSPAHHIEKKVIVFAPNKKSIMANKLLSIIWERFQ